MQNGICGVVPESRDDILSLAPGVSFEFAANETGSINDDGTVFFNNRGLEQYIFDNKEDSADNLIDGKSVSCHVSSYLGSRDDETDPGLEDRLISEGVLIDPDEDGSGIWSLPARELI